MVTVGIVGARGYVGKELADLLAKHDGVKVEMAVSARDGVTPEDVAAAKLDAYALALPNGACAAYVAAIEKTRPDAKIVDLSADNRFTDTWIYGQPERFRDRLHGATRISNPGCYATATQLAIAPLRHLLDAPAHVFGVSGYSGAGTTPSPKNDPEVLKDNLLPYSLTGHVHEREVTRHLGWPVFFAPHVAPFFRGITCTTSLTFAEPHSHDELDALYRRAYGGERLVKLSAEAPLVRDVMEKHHVAIGGLSVSADGKHAVVVSTIDNLLGGAATQAVRNLNLALGLPELTGIARDDA
ncbi:MAG: N-acetyl-gamma-glutamyl-phosphate reductase [Labilithrix sp.]|nr:N-acetyl-gamma-glutamyl-phosphate reductase [Labilithrix sp.]MCW5812099.1 N-acetyl-gamma-glutamyl-phosphate reductase [Labilithrix sp.]